MDVTVLFFATLKDRAGVDRMGLALPDGATVAAFKERLAADVPALAVAARLSRPSLFDLLRTAGVDLPFPEQHYGLGLGLGTGEVTMEELAVLYAALANRGVARPLIWSDGRDQTRARRMADATRPGARCRYSGR